MHRHLRSTVLLFLGITLFSACSKVPDHVRYIPRDAVMAAGVNLRSLGKKVAWNVITGSKLFKEMQNRLPEKSAKNAISGIEKAGIDAANTFYVYLTTDNKGTNRITGLVPLSSSAEWEAYVKSAFPKAKITEHGERKEASLGLDMYVGWNKNLLIIINVMRVSNHEEGADPDMESSKMHVSSSMGKVDLTAEMEKAFGVNKDNSITGDPHFNTLEAENHDLDFWLNYEQLMLQMGSDMAEKTGVTLSNSVWKGASVTAGFDFRKGKISGDMHYYLPTDMKDIGAEFGSANADKDMIDRLPDNNLDMLFALHLSPKGIKSVLEKMGTLGLANVTLSTQGMNVDNVLDAFTGDMAIVMNDFSLKTESVKDNFMGQEVVHQTQKPNLNVSYVIKINKKENFQKLVELAKTNGLKQLGNGFVIPLNDKDSVYIMMNDQYAVASNKLENVNAYLQGSLKSGKMPADLTGSAIDHPWVFYLDIQQMFRNIDPAISHSAKDSAMITESKKLLSNLSLTGGTFKDNAFDYHLDINFTNADENSIIAIMDYAMRMSDADRQNTPAN